MLMKKMIIFVLGLCLLLAGCGNTSAENNENAVPSVDMSTVAAEETRIAADQTEPDRKVMPLADTTMESLTDAILSVSLDEGNTYVDEDGHTQMELKIYTYDQYDMVDIANLKVGDILVRYSGEVEVISIEKSDSGRICINGGLENDGFDLVTDDSGIYYEIGYNDVKNWYIIGAATLRISDDFKCVDSADPELGEVVIRPEDFLNGGITNYDFTPYNTTVRVENGQIVEMNRVYTP
jgi:hypothetical protein